MSFESGELDVLAGDEVAAGGFGLAVLFVAAVEAVVEDGEPVILQLAFVSSSLKRQRRAPYQPRAQPWVCFLGGSAGLQPCEKRSNYKGL